MLFIVSAQTQSGTLDFQPTPEFPALQYLDSVDQGSQADRVGLKAADFLLEVRLLHLIYTKY